MCGLISLQIYATARPVIDIGFLIPVIAPRSIVETAAAVGKLCPVLDFDLLACLSGFAALEN